MEKIAAIILAAGKGTRMGDRDGSPIPKVMFEACGKPLIRHSVENVKKAGVEDITLVVGYKKEMIKDYFKDEVDYAIQEEQLGTGHAAMMAKKNLQGKSESVLICYGDMPLFKPETIKKLIEKYEGTDAASRSDEVSTGAGTPASVKDGMRGKPTVAMLSVNFDDPIYWVYGRIVRDNSGEVVGIIEQKDCTEDELKIKESNPGFYIFDANWFWQNIKKLNSDNAQNEYYLTDMIVMAKEQGKKIIAMPVSEEVEALGVNTPDQLKQAEDVLKSR